MKNFVVILLLVMSLHDGTCFAQDDKLSLKDQVDSLTSIKQFLEKENLSCEDKNRYRSLYYKSFPSTFNRFNAIFGYTDFPDGNGKANPLYYESMEYIDLFAEIFSQKHVLYWSRLISLSCGAHWDADAVNILQDYIQTTVKENVKDFCNLLSNYNDKVISDFWYFHFDGPHPEKYEKDYETLYLKIEGIDTKVAHLMKLSYDKILSEHDGHRY